MLLGELFKKNIIDAHSFRNKFRRKPAKKEVEYIFSPEKQIIGGDGDVIVLYLFAYIAWCSSFSS